MITANSCLRHILDLVRVHSHQSFHRDPGDISRWLFEGQCYHRWYGILDFIWKFEQNQILQYLSQSHLLCICISCRYLTIIGQYIPISFGKLGSDHTQPLVVHHVDLRAPSESSRCTMESSLPRYDGVSFSYLALIDLKETRARHTTYRHPLPESQPIKSWHI